MKMENVDAGSTEVKDRPLGPGSLLLYGLPIFADLINVNCVRFDLGAHLSMPGISYVISMLPWQVKLYPFSFLGLACCLFYRLRKRRCREAPPTTTRAINQAPTPLLLPTSDRFSKEAGVAIDIPTAKVSPLQKDEGATAQITHVPNFLVIAAEPEAIPRVLSPKNENVNPSLIDIVPTSPPPQSLLAPSLPSPPTTTTTTSSFDGQRRSIEKNRHFEEMDQGPSSWGESARGSDSSPQSFDFPKTSAMEKSGDSFHRRPRFADERGPSEDEFPSKKNHDTAIPPDPRRPLVDYKENDVDQPALDGAHKPMQFEETQFYRDYVRNCPAHRHVRHRDVIVVVNKSFLAKRQSWRDVAGASSNSESASSSESKAKRACIGFNNFVDALDFLVHFFDHEARLRMTFLVYPGVHQIVSLVALECFREGFEVDIVGSVGHSPPNPPIDVAGRNKSKIVCLQLGEEEVMGGDSSVSDEATMTPLATKVPFLPTCTVDKASSLSFSHVVAEFRGRLDFSVPFSTDPLTSDATPFPPIFEPSAFQVSFSSCALQTSAENKLCPSASFANLNVNLLKCKVRLGTWFHEAAVGNQIPIPLTCERVALVVRHCDLVEGKWKIEARSCLEMEDCWSLCFPLQLTGESKADIRSCQFANAGDIRFQGSRDAIGVQKASTVDVTECQFEAFGIALCVKHRGTSISAVQNVFKSCNTVALASTQCRIEMIENDGRGSGCLLVAIEKAESKLIGNLGDFKEEDMVQVDEETDDPLGDVDEVSVIPQAEVKRRPKAGQAANVVIFGKACANCSVVENALTEAELRCRNGWPMDEPVSPEAFVACPFCDRIFYCSPACLEEDAEDHAFVCREMR